MSELMDDDAILAAINQIAREYLEFDGALTPDASLVDVLKLDSLRLLTLVVEVENRFEIALQDGSEAEIRTAGDLVEAIRRHLEPSGE